MDSRLMFAIGDRVVALKHVSPYIKPGDTGTVCGNPRVPFGHVNNGRIRVCWDHYVHGHSCGLFCEDGYGYNCLPEDIMIEEQGNPTFNAEELYELWEEEFA